MKRQVIQNLRVEMIYDADEAPQYGGQARAVVALRVEAERLGFPLDVDRCLASGPTAVTGSNWDGKNPKREYDHRVYAAWGWVVTSDDD